MFRVCDCSMCESFWVFIVHWTHIVVIKADENHANWYEMNLFSSLSTIQRFNIQREKMSQKLGYSKFWYEYHPNRFQKTHLIVDSDWSNYENRNQTFLILSQQQHFWPQRNEPAGREINDDKSVVEIGGVGKFWYLVQLKLSCCAKCSDDWAIWRNKIENGETSQNVFVSEMSVVRCKRTSP